MIPSASSVSTIARSQGESLFASVGDGVALRDPLDIAKLAADTVLPDKTVPATKAEISAVKTPVPLNRFRGSWRFVRSRAGRAWQVEALTLLKLFLPAVAR
jgi:hypothetical protein